MDDNSLFETLDAEGIVVVPNVLNDGVLQSAREEIDRLIDEDIGNGAQVSGFDYDPDDRNIRIVDLVPRSRLMRSLVEHPLALSLVRHLLGDDFRLSNFSGNRTRPGSGAMGMHADQGFLPAPWPPYPMAINIGWALDDFTVENGATRYIAGSHLRDHGPDWHGNYKEAQAVSCSAGSLFAMDGRTWHQTGPNVTENESRTGLFAYYVRPFIVTQRPWPELIPPDLSTSLGAQVRHLLGLDSRRATTNLESRRT